MALCADSGETIVRPSVSNDTVLTSREFIDALLIRYGFPLQLPSSCDGCGGNFTLHHALSCNSGGLIIQRHDEVKRELIQLAQRVNPPSAVRDEPFIHAVSMPKANSTDGPSDAALSARGDILIRNMFSNGSETIIDVSLVHVDAQSHLSAEPLNVLRTREKTKKKKYLKACLQQHRSFVPFVVSTDGLLGPEAQMSVKKLAADLSIRWDQPKS
eukprot:scaffold9753_cov73-Cylindrotheca_fusiformis.AAC.1